ncbi:hypothetical protein ADN00_15035 [Ornatilinea apprima]|uniref:3-dehydrosphinganine reductase n=1 Tax=Ornatilinea apprima TaxID=1134406 RepID=A0A0P6XUJ2_9CHLR|nr:SDR family oxidoreductase [Ornatilinea apprima]KPL73100.1 hypothetical protein ADN00_15035 [Ornatilinea apprima]
MKSFAHQFVMISGGSSGIGLALAEEFARLGANLCILARREEMLAQAATRIQQQFASEQQWVRTISVDIVDRAALQEKLNACMQSMGVPDLVINSAGVAHPGHFENLSYEIFDWMMNVNYMGTVNVCKTVIPGMIQRRSGKIVNISSVAGFLGVYGYTAYSGSKFAVRGFSDALRSEMKLHNIQVQTVFPPDTQTPQLEYENQYKPKITEALSSSAGIMSAEKVAKNIIRGIQKHKPLIIPGFESQLMFFLSNLLGAWMYPIMDLMVKNASKK